MIGAGIGLAGLLLTAVSALIFMIPGIIFGIVMMVIGVILFIIGMASGWGEAFGDPRKKPLRREMNVYVIAKYITDNKAEFIFDPEFHDPEELKHVVKLQFSGGQKVEFETSPQVFDDVGDGMSGDIVYQGKWLSQFTFRPKEGHQDIGEDPFRAGKL